MWKTKKLHELCDIQSGLWKGKKEPFTKALVLRNTNFTAAGKFDYSDVVELEVETKQLVKREVIKNDIILEKSGGGDKTPVGRVCIHDAESDTPFSLSNFTARIRVIDKQELDAQFLHRFLNFLYISGKTETMQRHSTGIRNLQLAQYKEIDVPLPQLAEQQRIVAKLDAAFTEIDKAIELNDKRTKEVKNLIAKSQNELFLSISETASVMRLGDVAKFENGDRGKNYPSKKYQIDEGIPFVNAGDFSLDGDIETQSMVYISEERFNLLGAGKFKIDDVLFCLRGSLGKSAINKSIEIGAIASSLVILRAKQNIVSSDYLFAYIRSDIVKNLIVQTAGGTAQPNLSAKVVSNYEIPVPPLKEQQGLTEKFWLIREKGLVALDRISQKSQQLIELKAAILAKELQRKKSEAA